MQTLINSICMLKSITTIALLFLTAFANAGSEDCPKEHSVGYCILDYVDLAHGAKEISSDDLAKFVNVTGEESTSGKSVIDIASNGVYLLGAKSAFDLALGGAMGIFGLLGSSTSVGQEPQFFIMLPESEVVEGNPLKTAEDAWVKGISEILNIDSATLNEVRKTPTFASPYIRRSYSLEGGECGEDGCEAYAKFFYLLSSKPKVIDKPPTWLGNERLYIWATYSNNAYPNVRRNSDKKWMFPPSEMLKLVKKLPNWFYFYSPSKAPFIMTSNNILFFTRQGCRYFC